MNKSEAFTGPLKRVVPAPARLPRPGTLPVSGRPKLLLVDIRSGESLSEHPDVAPLLRDGWQVRRAEPRIGSNRKAQALIVLAPPESALAPAATASLVPWPFETDRRVET